MTQLEAASRAKISLTTLRELQNNTSPRRRRPQTLAALSEALGWPPDTCPRSFMAKRPILTTLRRTTRCSGRLIQWSATFGTCVNGLLHWSVD